MSDAAPEQERQKAMEERPVVASVLSSDRVVLNKGSDDGIKVGQRYLIYELDDEDIIDPITNESLGRLQVPKGMGKIVSVQKRMSVLESDQEPSGNPRPGMGGFTADVFTAAAKAPFRDPEVGDPVKKISLL